MFLVSINISIYRFSYSKFFHQVLFPLKISTLLSVVIFKLFFVFFNEILQKCVENCKNLSKKNNFLTKHKLNMKRQKYKNSNLIHVKLKNSNFFWERFL